MKLKKDSRKGRNEDKQEREDDKEKNNKKMK
jgi:hypothetical protein